MPIPLPSLALLEIDGIALGYVVADAVVKRAPVRLLSGEAVTPGKYLLLFAGMVAEVAEALAAGEAVAADRLLDKLYLPQAHPELSLALAGPRALAGDSLGIVETLGAASALLAADAACKGAQVSLGTLHLAKGIGGKGYFTLGGEQPDVEAALAAAAEAVASGYIVDVQLVASPHPELRGPVLPGAEAMLDAVIIGAGPNGLTAAATLARAGLRVSVLEAQAQPGGAVRTEALTEPGFLHDVGAGFMDWAPISPAFRELDLAGAGLSFASAPIDSAHLARDESCGVLARDFDRMRRELGADGEAWARIGDWRASLGQTFGDLALGALPLLRPSLAAGPAALAKLGVAALLTPAAYSRRFVTPAAQRIVPQLALHADTGPDDLGGGGVGFGLALSALDPGCLVAVGGSGQVTAALRKRLGEAGGELRLSTRVARIVVRGGAVAAVRTQVGEEIETRAVLADTTPWALCDDLVEAGELPGILTDGLRAFEHGWGTFKLDWALDGPVPWTAPAAREAAVVHLGGDIPELRLFTSEVRAGALPSHPYLLVGQQSLCDPSRAPPGKHTLYAYTHVPSVLPGGWATQRERFADRVEAEIEAQAPGFRGLVRARALHSPPNLEAFDENLVGGDLGGGTARLGGQFFFRPAFPYFRHRMGVRGLYLCSSSTHPGAGVHGACGYNAALIALADLGRVRQR